MSGSCEVNAARSASGQSITLATEGKLDIIQRLLTDKPSFHDYGAARWDALPGALEAIRRSAKHGDSTLETGVGVSTVVFAATGASHTAISPITDEHQRVRDYCQRIGIGHHEDNH